MNTPTELENRQQGFALCPLAELTGDMKRMLKVQVKEFVHFIEDKETPGEEKHEQKSSLIKCEEPLTAKYKGCLCHTDAVA